MVFKVIFAAVAALTSAASVAAWDYSEKTDPMDNKTVYYAICASTDGRSSIVVANREGKPEVRVITPVNDARRESIGYTIRYEFEGTPRHLAIGADGKPRDGTSFATLKAFALSPDEHHIASLSTARRTLIRVPLYREGLVTFTYDTAGLDLSRLKFGVETMERLTQPGQTPTQ